MSLRAQSTGVPRRRPVPQQGATVAGGASGGGTIVSPSPPLLTPSPQTTEPPSTSPYTSQTTHPGVSPYSNFSTSPLHSPPNLESRTSYPSTSSQDSTSTSVHRTSAGFHSPPTSPSTSSDQSSPYWDSTYAHTYLHRVKPSGDNPTQPAHSLPQQDTTYASAYPQHPKPCTASPRTASPSPPNLPPRPHPAPPPTFLPFGGPAEHLPGHIRPPTPPPHSRTWRTDTEVAANPLPIRRVDPACFALPPESPELHFIDPILNIQIPGVSDRLPQHACTMLTQPKSSHQVCPAWPLHDWPDYHTGFADHGLTYQDYLLLKAGVVEMTQRCPGERDTELIKRAVAFAPFTFGASFIMLLTGRSDATSGSFTSLPKKGVLGTVDDIKKLFKEASGALQRRGVGVKIKVKKRRGWEWQKGEVYQAYEVQVWHIVLPSAGMAMGGQD